MPYRKPNKTKTLYKICMSNLKTLLCVLNLVYLYMCTLTANSICSQLIFCCTEYEMQVCSLALPDKMKHLMRWQNISNFYAKIISSSSTYFRNLFKPPATITPNDNESDQWRYIENWSNSLVIFDLIKAKKRDKTINWNQHLQTFFFYSAMSSML